MGKFSYKKRKGTRKQSFKNRKRVKKGGSNHENKEAAAADAVNTQEAAVATTTTDNTDQKEAAGNTQVDNTAENAQAGNAQADANVNATGTEAGQTGDAAGDAAGQTEAGQTGNAQADANVNATGTEAGQTGDAAGDAAGQTEAGQTGDATGQDWKEGLNQEAVEQAEQKVVDIEKQANESGGVLNEKTIDDLVDQLEKAEGVPDWAKALARTGGEILKKNPALADKLTSMGLKIIENADVSGATVNTGAPGAQNTGTGAPGANTGAAAPGGSYTADDAGYQKFVEAVKTNPETLKNVVYVNDQMTQIFLKNPNG